MKKSDIKHKHFEKAIKKINPTITPKTKKSYEEFKEHLTDFTPSYVG